MSEKLTRILKRDKPKADIVEGMTRTFFKQTEIGLKLNLPDDWRELIS